MTSTWTIDWERSAGDRAVLARRILDALEAHPHVARAELFGSLTSHEPDGYPADELSDIDIRVTLNSGTDREFFDDVERTFAPVGRTLLYNLFVSDASAIRSLMIETYSPFWHVDLVCYAPLHVLGRDDLNETQSERAFGSWVSAAKRFARAGDFLGYFLELAPYADASAHHNSALLFRDLLEQWRRQGGDDLRFEIGESVLRRLFPAT